jgi:hypothetical protein
LLPLSPLSPRSQWLAAFFAGHGIHAVAGKGDRAAPECLLRAGQALKKASPKLQKEQLSDFEFSQHQQITAR